MAQNLKESLRRDLLHQCLSKQVGGNMWIERLMLRRHELVRARTQVLRQRAAEMIGWGKMMQCTLCLIVSDDERGLAAPSLRW